MTSRPMEALAIRVNGVNHSAIEPLGISPHRTYKSLRSNLFLETQVEVVSTVTAHMTVPTHTLSDVTTYQGQIHTGNSFQDINIVLRSCVVHEKIATSILQLEKHCFCRHLYFFGCG